jgi:hypothetical protein
MTWNSIPGFRKSVDPESQEAIGITQFSLTDSSSWFQIIGGLIIQGGSLTAAGIVQFSAPYEKQVLGVFINGGTASLISLTGFTSSSDGYWFAIGV